jgi:hypothetical protein
VCGVTTLSIARPFVTTARPVQARRKTPTTRVRSRDVPLEKCEWMSALSMAKVKAATKKQSPTSTALFLVDVFVSPSSAYRAGCGVRLADWSSVAAFMVPPMIERYVVSSNRRATRWDPSALNDGDVTHE